MAATPHSQKIMDAHNTGRLFVHMLEMSPIEGGHWTYTFLRFLDVLAGKQGASFGNEWHSISAKPDGYVGMPTTALHSAFPVSAWTERSQVGLLFEAGEPQHFRPFFVSSTDANSHVTASDVEIRKCEHLEGLREIQDLPNNNQPVKFSLYRDLPDRERKAEQALQYLWHKTAEKGWAARRDEGYTVGINEVLATAHMKGVRGLVVSETTMKIPYYTETKEQLQRRLFVEGVKQARQIRDYLSAHYLENIPTPLPVFSYNPNRTTNKLVELSPEQLLNPGRFYDEMHPEAGAEETHPRIADIPGGGVTRT